MQPGQRGEHVQHRASAVALDDRGERPRQGERPEEVRLQLKAYRVQFAADESRSGGDPGVVHEQCRVGCDAGRGPDRLFVGHVQAERGDACQIHGLRAPRRRVHLRSALYELVGQMAAQPSVGPGDDSDRALEFHVHSR